MTGSTISSGSSRRFLIDENLPRSLAPEFVKLGHIAEHVYDLGMGGAKDPAVFAYAQAQSATIVTGDKDFSNVRAYPPPHAGIVVIEVPDTLPPDARKHIILGQIATLAGQALANALVIIEPNRIRIRR